MIIIEPMGGLGNRMRGLDSALALAHARRRRLRVVWMRNEQLNCPFCELFEVPHGPVELVERNGLGVAGRLQYRLACMVEGLRYPSLDDATIYRLKKEGFDFAADSVPVRRFRTCRSFYPGSPPFGRLIPVPSLRQAIAALHRKRQIGVHLRRTDNVEAIKHSPTSRFIDIMRREIELDPLISFYLATDAPEEERLLQETFPGRVQVHAKRSLDRRTPEAAQDALIDLYALGNCEKIIASYWSSFSDVAAEIRGIEKIVVRQP